MANKLNGMANASAKANMPTAGPRMLLVLAASTSSVPIMGPVHENDTITSVNAMKNMLSKPVVRSAALSTLFDHESGSLILNMPKNEKANTTSSKKNTTLHTALVASALSESAPEIAVTTNPSARYMTMIDKP